MISWNHSDESEIPDEIYTSQEIYDREIEVIFHGRHWNFVGLEAEVPNIGDYKRSYVGPTPVVVSRAKDGSINVFENRCSHRAVEFCRKPLGNNKTFVWAVTPNSIVLDGGKDLEIVQSDGTVNWTVSGSAPTVTTILTNAPNFDIFSNG